MGSDEIVGQSFDLVAKAIEVGVMTKVGLFAFQKGVDKFELLGVSDFSKRDKRFSGGKNEGAKRSERERNQKEKKGFGGDSRDISKF